MAEEKKEGVEKKTPELSFLLVVLAGVALVAVLLTIYFTGGRPPGQNDEPGAAMLSSPQAMLLFESFGKRAGISEYTIEYSESSVGLPTTVKLISGSGARAAFIGTAMDLQEIYYSGNRDYVCETYGGERKCALVNQSQLLENFAGGNGGMFFDNASVTREKEKLEYLIRKGAVSFSGGVEDREIGGVSCKQVNYTINYRKLNVEELAVIGINAGSPIITQYSGFKWGVCLGEDGVEEAYSLRYVMAGENYTSSREVTSFAARAEGIELPKNLSSEKEVEDLVSVALSKRDNYLECEKWVSSKDKDRCYKEKAVSNNDEKYCAQVRDAVTRDKCYIALAGKAGGQGGMCSFVAVLKDDCWGQAAFVSGNQSLCGMISNQTMMESCNASFAPECATDADCETAGCSGTLCVKKGGAQGIVTTCEFVSEYACYGKFGGCGCIEGKCAWGGGDNLSECVANARAQAGNSSG